MKVFIVTSGWYSDYGINAAFSTKEKAEKYIKPNLDEMYGIEEWEVDEKDNA